MAAVSTAPRRAAVPPLPRHDAPSSRPSPQPRPDLRVVPAPSHPVRFVLVVAFAVAVGVFGTVSLDALAAEAAFEARGLEAQVEELSLRHDELTAEVAALESPAHVRQVAVHELGMVPAEGAAYLAVPTGSAEARG